MKNDLKIVHKSSVFRLKTESIEKPKSKIETNPEEADQEDNAESNNETINNGLPINLFALRAGRSRHRRRRRRSPRWKPPRYDFLETELFHLSLSLIRALVLFNSFSGTSFYLQNYIS